MSKSRHAGLLLVMVLAILMALPTRAKALPSPTPCCNVPHAAGGQALSGSGRFSDCAQRRHEPPGDLSSTTVYLGAGGTPAISTAPPSLPEAQSG